MTSVPARLVYTDSNSNEQVIGSFQPQDVTNGNISTFTVDEEARNYTRVIIEGGPTLQQAMPATLSEFGTSEPEIRVEIDSNLDGTWETRTRVYPEQSGSTDERGHYKNKNLWGFKKYYGEDSVNTGTLTSTDLTSAVQALLPSGYTAQYASGETPPNISEYSYRGPRQQGFSELQKEYDHFIIFTSDTDGSGDFIVKVEPFGFGSTAKSLVRGQDGYTYSYWKSNDLSNVVSRVNIVGKDSNNSKVDLTYQAGTDTGDPEVDTYLTGLPDPERNVFKRFHIDHTIDSNDAEEIARSNLEPTGTEHGAIEATLDASSTLNQSVGLLDETRNIDDIYTVVKQKDYFHQGITFYSFEFEQEATDQQRDKWREHDNERAKVYPGGQTQVGQQNFTGDTGSAPSDTSVIGSLNQDSTNQVPAKAHALIRAGNGTNNVNFTLNIPSIINSSTTSKFFEGVVYHFVVGNYDDDVNDKAWDWFIQDSNNNTIVSGSETTSQYQTTTVQGFIPNTTVSEGDELNILIQADGTVFATPGTISSGDPPFHSYVEFEMYSVPTHVHDDGYDSDDFNHGGTGDAAGQHGTSGTTDSKNVETAQEDKTDR